MKIDGGMKEVGLQNKGCKGTWGDIIRVTVGRVIEKLGLSFSGSFGMKIGDGSNTFFLLDKWVGKF